MYRTMRLSVIVLTIILANCPSRAQDDAKKKPAEGRFGYKVDEELYPQKSPAEAMKAIVTAMDRKRIDYLLAQLADPAYVDYWVDQYKKDVALGADEGKSLIAFNRLTRETTQYFQSDPLIVKELRVFAREAKWTDEGDTAIGVVDTISARKVYLKKIGERWFLENRQQ